MRLFDMELLKKLYKIYSPTGREWPMIKFVSDWIEDHVKEADVRIDRWGNLYITRTREEEGDKPGNASGNLYEDGGYPTLCCHIDQAQKVHSEDFTVIEEDGILYGFSPSRKEKEGPGADDKNGLWICLNALMECDHLKVFMAVGEEKGCWGSNRADISFFKDSLYILEPDCKGGEEIRTFLRGVPVASKEFEEALEADKFGYVITEGKTTDILPLTLSGAGVSCANIPCGYYQRHKDDEYCKVEELLRCRDFVLYTVKNLRKKFPNFYKTETQKWVESESKIQLFQSI